MNPERQYDPVWLAHTKAEYEELFHKGWDEIKPSKPHSVRRRFWRKVAWGVLFVLIALWVGYETAPYLGMFAVTLQEGLK